MPSMVTSVKKPTMTTVARVRVARVRVARVRAARVRAARAKVARARARLPTFWSTSADASTRARTFMEIVMQQLLPTAARRRKARQDLGLGLYLPTMASKRIKRVRAAASRQRLIQSMAILSSTDILSFLEPIPLVRMCALFVLAKQSMGLCGPINALHLTRIQLKY